MENKTKSSIKYCLYKKKFNKQEETVKKIAQALYRSDSTKESTKQAIQLMKVLYEI